ncbi:MAG: hypothetical protein KAY37_14345, partial [Phycisphaerae bacterium]|nr:hypothetical protein [Phycisphaerae bacterium]
CHTRSAAAFPNRHRWATQVLCLLVCAGIGFLPLGCQSLDKNSADAARTLNDRHMRLYGDADLPRKIGSVENVGVQIPVISPDGQQMLYLRTDQDHLLPMTLLGSSRPEHTPPEGTLSIWRRSLEGSSPGYRISQQNWAHSPVWSDSGNAIAYVANEPSESFIVHLDLGSGEESILGVRGAINCLPRFDGDDRTLLFCSGESAAGPFRVYRQTIGEGEPVVLSPPGPDCVFPIASNGLDSVLCAQAEGEHLNWIKAGSAGMVTVAPEWGVSARPALLQTWAGVANPLSPDRAMVLFYDIVRERISVLHVAERIVRRHRRGSIASCWLEPQTIAIATPDGVFVVNTTTGASVSVFNGQWLPCRYVAPTRRLILLGRETPRKFAIWELVFRPRPASE